MSRYRKTFREAMAEVELNEVGYLQSRLNDKQIMNIKKIWQFKTKSDVTPAVKKMIANMDVPTQLAIKDAGIKHISDLIEGRMSEIDAMVKDGKSAAQIAKALKIDVKAVKAILGEEEGDSAQDMQDAKPAKEKIKENVETWSEAADEMDKKKKKDDVAPDSEAQAATEKTDDKEKLKAAVDQKQAEINQLKAKAETDKAKVAKKETEKMVNPETGEPLLQVGIAYKHMRDKMKREKEQVKEETLEEAPDSITPMMLKTLKKEYEPFRGKKITAARAKQLMNILDKLNDKNLEILGKANIPFVSSGSKSKLVVRKMKFKTTTINPFKEGIDLDEEMFEACWTGYKQVGMKNKGGKQVPNCVPEEQEETIKEYSTQQIKQAYGIANDPRYKQGNYSGAVSAIEKLAKGLSRHPDVQKVLKRTNEDINEGKFTKLHNLLIQKGRMAQAKDKQGENNTDKEIAKQKKFLGMNEALNKDDEKVVKKVKDMLKGASQAHGDQAKELDKALKNEMKKDDAYAIGMSQAKKVMNDEPPLAKKTIKKGHEIADKILKKEQNENHPSREIYEQIKGLKNKAEKSGMPYGILKKVYDRGMAAWRGGHRPGATQQQWAFARVNSFVTKSSGTWGGADKDLAKQVKGK